MRMVTGPLALLQNEVAGAPTAKRPIDELWLQPIPDKAH